MIDFEVNVIKEKLMNLRKEYFFLRFRVYSNDTKKKSHLFSVFSRSIARFLTKQRMIRKKFIG